MSFASPAAFAFLLVGIPIVLLYLFRIRRRTEPVPSLALWQRLVHETKFTSWLKRLRRIFSMLLQLLIASVIVFALARPELDLSGIQRKSIAIVLDNSASMMSIEKDGRSRFEIARERAREIVEERSVLDEVMIVLGSTRTEVVSPLTRDRRRLIEILDEVQPLPLATDLPAAYRLATGLLRGRQNPMLVVISDGGAGQLQDLPLVEEIPIHAIVVGETSDNVGITGFRARKNIAMGTDTIHVEVMNASQEAKSLSMELRVDGKTRRVIPLEIAAGESHRESIDLQLPEGGVLEVSLDIEDALEVDNRAWAVVLPQKQQRLIIVCPEGRDFFLRAACESMEEVVDLVGSRIITPEAYDQLAPEERAADATIFQDRLPENVPEQGNLIFIAVSGDRLPFRTGREETLPVIQDWDETHPINRMVSWEGLEVPSCLPALGTREGALVETFGGALVASRVQPDRRAVYLGFDVIQADFPFRIGFPVLLRNILAWFHEEETRVFEPVYRTGAVISPLRDLPGEEALVQFPGEGTAELASLKLSHGRFAFAGTTFQGPVRIDAGDDSYLTCVNLADRYESAIGPTRESADAEVAQASLLLHREFWRAFAAIALFLVFAEWGLFQRRVTD
ncbi:MAG: BatA and WFA domain-containing protein [Planctomycetota bacterium]|nr:BatA and WFA domain-containing protein [Planctomycetota bacterium]